MEGTLLLTALLDKDLEIRSLKEENANLRTALDRVLASVSEPTATQSFRFLALPFDLRFAIYELCMVKGTVYIAPRPKHDHRYDNVGPFPKKPEWALLRVNRQVRSESAKVLLSKNHFVLSYVDGRECFWSRDVYAAMEAESISLPGLVRRNLNSVSIAFDNRGYADGPLELADFAMRFFEGKDYEKKGDQILEVHAFMCLNTRRWEFMCEFLSQTSVLRIDITNSYSPLGCCHYVLQAADAMAEGFNNSSFPTRLEISCTKNSWSVTLGTILRAALEKPTAVNDGSFVLPFKGMECNDDCLDLHRRDIDDELDDEEIGLGAIILDSDMVDHEGISDSDSD